VPIQLEYPSARGSALHSLIAAANGCAFNASKVGQQAFDELALHFNTQLLKLTA
jgi:hypothetical protein